MLVMLIILSNEQRPYVWRKSNSCCTPSSLSFADQISCLDCRKMLPRTTNLTVPERPANLPSLTVTMSATLMLLPLASGAVIFRFSGNFLLISGRRQILTLGLSAVPCCKRESGCRSNDDSYAMLAVAYEDLCLQRWD